MHGSPENPPQRGLGIVFAVVLLDLVGFGMMLPLLPFYAQRFHEAPWAAGLLFSFYSLAQLLFSPLLGRLSDRHGRRPVLLAVIALDIVAYALFWSAGSLAWLVAARFLSGVAAVYGLSQAVVADLTPPAERSRAMGILGAAFGVAFILGPALGGILSQRVSYQAVPAVAAALSVLNLLVAAAWLPESLPAAARRRTPGPAWYDLAALPRLLRASGTRDLLLLIFLVTFCFAMMESTLSLFAQQRFRFAQTESSYLFAYIGVLMAIVQGGLLGRIVKRFGEGNLVRAGIVSIGLGLVLLPFSTTLAPLLGCLALLAVGSALYTPSSVGLLSRRTQGTEQGATLGLSRSASALARTLGPALGTALFGVGLAWPFWSAALLLVAALGITARLVPQES